MAKLMHDFTAQAVRDDERSVQLQCDVAVDRPNQRDGVPLMPAAEVAMVADGLPKKVLDHGLTLGIVFDGYLMGFTVARGEIERQFKAIEEGFAFGEFEIGRRQAIECQRKVSAIFNSLSDRFIKFRCMLIEKGLQQPVFAPEEMIERRFGNPRLSHDLLDADTLISFLREQCEGRTQ